MKRTVHQYIIHASFYDFLRKTIASRYLGSVNSKFSTERGHRMAVYANDFIGVGIYTEGVYERADLEVIFEFLTSIIDFSQKTVALDIGANIGNHSIYFSKYFTEVHAFEPNPSTFQLLSFNAQFSDKIRPYNFGLGEREEQLTMHEVDTNFGGSSVVYEVTDSSTTVEIKINRLDDLEIDLSNLGLIKIDVEGMEYSVLKGGLGTIKRTMPVVLFEQNIQDFLGNEEGTNSSCLLAELGYTFFWLERDSLERPWILRRLKNLKEVFFGRAIKYNIVSGDTLPKGTYSMVIALPPKFRNVGG